MRAGVLILVAAAVSAPAAAASAANATAVGGSCAAARRAATRGLQCSIAKGGGCDNGYARAYFCAAPGFGRVALGACYLAWLGLLFALLGSTADEYFSPALEQLSDDAGLPPRFAGVTLLALGNGAPDVSSTIHAVASSPTGYRLALGALTGAGMFVGTCVAGAVTLVADGAKCRGALLRDVSAYFLTVVLVGAIVGVRGVVTGATVAGLLGVYAIFVLVVLLADLWHRRPGGPFDRDRERRAADESDEPPAVEMLLTLLHDVRRRGPAAGDDRDEEKDGGSPASSSWARNPFFDGGGDEEDVDAAPVRARDTVVLDGGADDALALGGSPLDGDAFGRSLLGGDGDAVGAAGPPPAIALDLVDRARAYLREVRAGRGLARALAILELPFTAARRATVPLTSGDAYGRAPLCLSVAGAPLWLCFYAARRGFDGVFAPTLASPVFLATLGGVACAGAIARGTAAREDGLPAPLMIALALFGFVVAATWIDVFADELVGVLEFFGSLLGVPEPVLGLTVLAWGNSVGDLSTNLAMAKKGLANMALTACFAGPVFNMLVGLGLGFWTRLRSDGGETPVKIDAGLGVGFAMIALNCALVVATGVARGGSLPRTFGYVSLSLYAAYLCLSIAVLFTAEGEDDE